MKTNNNWCGWPHFKSAMILRMASAVLIILSIMGCSGSREQVPSGFWISQGDESCSTPHNGILFHESTFEYYVNPRYSLNPLKSFGGHYDLLFDSIELRIEYYDILSDFRIGTDSISIEDNQWAAVGGILVRLPTPENDVSVLSFRQSKDTIWIDEYQVYIRTKK